ncbi:protein of unknown function [Paraburkholderia kururiensis]
MRVLVVTDARAAGADATARTWIRPRMVGRQRAGNRVLPYEATHAHVCLGARFAAGGRHTIGGPPQPWAGSRICRCMQ